MVAVAFDGKSSLHSLDHQVDAITMIGRIADTDLCADMKSLASDLIINMTFERRLKALGCFIRELAFGMKHVLEQAMTVFRLFAKPVRFWNC